MLPVRGLDGQVLQVRAHDANNPLEALQLLEEEDVQRREEALVLGVRRALELVDLLAEDLLNLYRARKTAKSALLEDL